MTLEQFAHIFAPLAIQLRQTDADEATIRGYYRVLQDLEPEFVAMAAERFAQSAAWFPKTSEWRAMARTVEHERAEVVRLRLQQSATPLCAVCEDTGWRPTELGDRFTPCTCRELRRLEALGRRPLPDVPERRAFPVPESYAATAAIVAPLVRAK